MLPSARTDYPGVVSPNAADPSDEGTAGERCCLQETGSNETALSNSVVAEYQPASECPTGGVSSRDK